MVQINFVRSTTDKYCLIFVLLYLHGLGAVEPLGTRVESTDSPRAVKYLRLMIHTMQRVHKGVIEQCQATVSAECNKRDLVLQRVDEGLDLREYASFPVNKIKQKSNLFYMTVGR